MLYGNATRSAGGNAGPNAVRQVTLKAGGTQTTYSIDKHLEIEKQGNRATYRHYIDGIAILNKEVVSSTTT